jgi:hypothetical protein
MRRFPAPSRILTLAAVCFLAALPAGEPLASAAEIGPIIDPIGPIGPAPVVPPIGSFTGPFLVGHFSGLTVKPTKAGNFVKVKGLLTIVNSGLKVAKNVRVIVYLSPDGTRTPGDAPISKLELAAFDHGDGKIEERRTETIPLKYKLPTLIAANLAGKYLIFVFVANNFPAKDGTPVVEGPLPKVP